jgi:arginyl-tRNA synthetase
MKMSKRAGNYITMREVLKEVGTDAIRFTMISRNADKKIDFDLDVFLHKNKDNPVFYIQYAHARCSSVVKIAKEKFGDEFVSNLKNINNLTELQIYEEKQIIKQVCSFYNVIKSSAQNFEPHRISNFLFELAKTFHNYWALGNIDESKRIIIGDDLMVSKSRIHLIVAVKSVIKKGLDLLKIDCPESM